MHCWEGGAQNLHPSWANPVTPTAQNKILYYLLLGMGVDTNVVSSRIEIPSPSTNVILLLNDDIVFLGT